ESLLEPRLLALDEGALRVEDGRLLRELLARDDRRGGGLRRLGALALGLLELGAELRRLLEARRARLVERLRELALRLARLVGDGAEVGGLGREPGAVGVGLLVR